VQYSRRLFGRQNVDGGMKSIFKKYVLKALMALRHLEIKLKDKIWERGYDLRIPYKSWRVLVNYHRRNNNLP
jgi:hypothetical protein